MSLLKPLAKPLLSLRSEDLLEKELAATKNDLAVQIKALQQLHELSMDLASPLELDTKLQGIIETIVELHSAPYGSIFLYNSVSGFFEVKANVGLIQNFLDKITHTRPSPNSGACGATFFSKRRIIVEDIDKNSLYDRFRDVAHKAGFCAVHTTPIITRSGEILGVLSIYFKKVCRPSPHEIQLADMCARHAADIIDANKVQLALRDSEQRFRTMADNAPVMVWGTDQNGFCTFLSKSWYDFTGQTDETGLGFGWFQAIHPEDRVESEKIYRESHEKQKAFQFEYRLLNKNGEYRWVLDAVAPWFGLNGEFLGYIGSVMDISERKQNEETIQQINNQLEARVKERTIQLEIQSNRLRTLADQVVNTEQRERKRIAAILHDHLQQILVASTFQLAEAARSIKNQQFEMATTYLDRGKDFLTEAIRSARSLTTELRPPVLYEDGLVPAFEWLARKFKNEHDLTILLNVEEVNLSLSDSLKIMIFESVKELLFNVVKHAQVKTAQLTFKFLEAHILYLCVEDKGTGFEIHHQQEGIFSANEGGMGLFSIRERLKILNADFDILSCPNEGTKIEIQIPLAPSVLKEETALTQKTTSQQETTHTKNRGKTIKILLVDDHKIVREGIANLLKAKSEFQVVAQAEDGFDAIEKTASFLPDVIIMDINMPKLNGIEATRLIKKNFPQTHIIGLSVQDENDVADSMKKAGALTLLNKTGDPEDLIQTILNCMQSSKSSSKIHIV